MSRSNYLAKTHPWKDLIAKHRYTCGICGQVIKKGQFMMWRGHTVNPRHVPCHMRKEKNNTRQERVL